MKNLKHNLLTKYVLTELVNDMGIEFVPVPGLEDIYSVSKCGLVKDVSTGRVRSTVVSNTGYEMVVKAWGSSSKGTSRTKHHSVHRLVALTYIPMSFDSDGNIRDTVNHIDGNKLNNHISNLEWTTHKENMSHSSRTGLSTGGYKLSEEDIDFIIAHRDAMTVKDICQKFNISQPALYYVMRKNRIATGE